MEIWKTIDALKGYAVSNYGNIKNIKTNRILKGYDNGSGYLAVSVNNKKMYIHRLVAMAFLDNPRGVNYVNHIDYNKQNNNVNNLEWCTQKENVHHSIINMKHRKAVTHSNTGEKYISKRRNKYRVIIDKKEYRSCNTLKDAIAKRDSILNGEVI